MTGHHEKLHKHGAMAEMSAAADTLRRWDPISIEPGVFGPAGEIDSYAPHIVSMLVKGCTNKELAAYLEPLCVDTMGLSSSASNSQAHNLQFAMEIVNRLRNGS